MSDLIERLEKSLQFTSIDSGCVFANPEMIQEAAARLKELEAEATRQLKLRRDADQLADTHRERAEKAEAERDILRRHNDELAAHLGKQSLHIVEMTAERDAIEAATIDRILLTIIPGGNICDPQAIADSIRALKPPVEEGK